MLLLRPLVVKYMCHIFMTLIVQLDIYVYVNYFGNTHHLSLCRIHYLNDSE